MEKKTFQDCCERVARNLELDYTGNLFPTLEQEQDFYKKAAELYNSETAQALTRSEEMLNVLRDDIDKFKEENERLKELSDRWGTELLKLKDDYNSLKQFNSEL